MSVIEDKIRAYLSAKNEPISRDELLRVATGAGERRTEVYKAISDIQNLVKLSNCDIGVWWGYKDPRTRDGMGELKTLWLRLYPMSDEEKAERIIMLSGWV